MSAAPGAPGGPPPPPTRGNRGNRNAANIRGPQSALTDFLASHNISAAQIRTDADARRAAALASQQAAANAQGSSANQGGSSASATPDAAEAPVKNETTLQKKRRIAEEKAIAKIKASKRFQRRKNDLDGDTDEEDEIARRIFEEEGAPLPKQEADCEVCAEHFEVTVYSAAGPDGSGFLCPTCTREFEDNRPRKKVAVQGRKARSNALDLVSSRGAKTLVMLSVETLVKNVDLADSLGDDMPDKMVDQLAALLSKKRLIDPRTFDLFLRPESDTVNAYDCAKLQSDDFIRMFQLVPNLKNLRIRNCIQFKNKVMEYLITCPTKLEHFSIAGANLIDDDHWSRFFMKKGSHLRSLKVYHTDNHFGDEQLELLKIHCPELVRLKVTHNQKITSAGLFHIAELKKLQHLTLEIYNYTDTDPYISIINSIGSNLRTLCLRKIEYLEDTVLEAIHNNCTRLQKLHLMDNETFTDQAFEKMFTNWSNLPLVDVNFQKCRHIESTVPSANPDGIGFCSKGFVALMNHSGRELKKLNVCADRHISRDAFETIFNEKHNYSKIEALDLSFCWGVNDDVIGAICRCVNGGSLKSIKVFGNFGVTDAWDKGVVPRGVFLIGMPTGHGMHIEGMGPKMVWGS